MAGRSAQSLQLCWYTLAHFYGWSAHSPSILTCKCIPIVIFMFCSVCRPHVTRHLSLILIWLGSSVSNGMQCVNIELASMYNCCQNTRKWDSKVELDHHTHKCINEKHFTALQSWHVQSGKAYWPAEYNASKKNEAIIKQSFYTVAIKHAHTHNLKAKERQTSLGNTTFTLCRRMAQG